MTKKLLVLPGDGIGPEVIAEAIKVLTALQQQGNFEVNISYDDIGGAAIDASGVPITADCIKQAHEADAVLLGAVGGGKWDNLAPEARPERGLLSIRSELGLFANLRPALLYPQLVEASTLRAEVVSNLDLLIVRELTGGIYFGKPRGINSLADGTRLALNTMVYSESEIERIARAAFDVARKRNKRLCSVDKANVLEVSMLWREVVTAVAKDYPDVELTHMYVDNAAMQLVRSPKQFDVIVTSNMFGDILSDCAAMLTGSIGMLASASLDEHGKGMYEPVHGSAPDIAGQQLANPIATILSLALLLRYTWGEEELAKKLEAAVAAVLEQGLRTRDICTTDGDAVSTSVMGDAIVAALSS